MSEKIDPLYDKWWRDVDSLALTKSEGKTSVGDFNQHVVWTLYHKRGMTANQAATWLLDTPGRKENEDGQDSKAEVSEGG